MSRTGAYGQSFALKHLENGELEAALSEANKEIARDTEDPEAVLDRAQVYLAMHRYEDCVDDLTACRLLDADSPILDDNLVDDTYFTALVGWGQKVAPEDPEAAVAIIERYPEAFPDGSHSAEVEVWTKRFRGQTAMWVKPRS